MFTCDQNKLLSQYFVLLSGCGCIKMGVKLAFLVILVTSVVSSKELCRHSKGHKLSQVICSNFNATHNWGIHLPLQADLEKLVFRNVTGRLDLSNFTLEHLKHLVVSHSQLENFSLGHFPELVFLTTLKNQKFPDLTQDLFSRATHVNWLSLVSNNHTITPSAFHLLKNLTWLHVQNEKLEHLSGDFLKENTNLHELAIRNCQLQRIDADAFKQTTELEILSLNFNRIKYFDSGTFKSLRNLKILELHHNHFTDLNFEQFRGLVSLEVLGLPSNFLRSVTSDALLRAFPNLKKMEMRKKDLMGHGKELIRELRKEGVDIIGTPHDCHYPLTTCHIL